MLSWVGLLARDTGPLLPRCKCSEWIARAAGTSPTVAGPRRHLTGFPVTPEWAPRTWIQLSEERETRDEGGTTKAALPTRAPCVMSRRRRWAPLSAGPPRRPAERRCRSSRDHTWRGHPARPRPHRRGRAGPARPSCRADGEARGRPARRTSATAPRPSRRRARERSARAPRRPWSRRPAATVTASLGRRIERVLGRAVDRRAG